VQPSLIVEILPLKPKPGIHTRLLVELACNSIHRRHQYDPAGELTRTLDKLRGEITYDYEANGQLNDRDAGCRRSAMTARIGWSKPRRW